MGLIDVVAQLVVAVVLLVVVATVVCLDRSQLAAARRRFGPRLREIAPHLALLAGILAVNRVARGLVPTFSWILDLNISGAIFAIEGGIVGTVQTVQGPVLTAFFSFMYLPGYIALLVFPYVAYFALEELRFAKQTAVAYAVNYAVGLVCYLTLISYGPRNVIPDLVDQPLYTTYPETQLLTGQMNANTNAFPSLHAAMAVTVALLAVRTREAYPRWPYLAVPTTASVLVATVYLGIHWVTDVVAGAMLGAFSVWFAARRYELRR